MQQWARFPVGTPDGRRNMLKIQRSITTALGWALAACLILIQENSPSHAARAETLEQRLLSEPSAALAADARRDGDPARGAATFYSRAMACSTCHSVGDRLDSIGPDLAKIAKKTTDAALVEAILEPSKSIATGYATLTVQTNAGSIISGLLVEETAERLVLREASQPDKAITLKKQEIVDRQVASQSVMPSGQVNQLADRRQFLDLLRYLIELREGGVERARQLQPSTVSFAAKVPDEPLPWQPVVLRGEVAVEGRARYPRAVALGFVGGTVLFDADQLGTSAVWFDGFVRSSSQSYFGLYWHRSGGAPERMSLDPHPLRFKLSDQDHWQAFEPPPASDPNTGSRFDGHQVCKSAVRLHYRVLVARRRIRVVEEVRAESRPDWQGFSRAFEFYELPVGARVALSLPTGEQLQFHGVRGEPVAGMAEVSQAPLLAYRSGGGQWAARAQAAPGATWLPAEAKGQLGWRLVSSAACDREPVVLRIDMWKYRGHGAAPNAVELASLEINPTTIADVLDRPLMPSPPEPSVKSTGPDSQIIKRSASSSAEDSDQIAKVRSPLATRIDASADGRRSTKTGTESASARSQAAGSATIRHDASPGYVMEDIPAPFPGCRPSDIAFSNDGTMYAIAMTEGQIWRTPTPPAGHPERVRWHRYATGLHHPLGLAMVDGRLYVAQKPEITELTDHDDDGTVDHYRTVATGWGLSTGWHEYCFGLAVDPQQNLWFALNTGFFWTHPGFVNPGRWRGSVIRVGHDTEKLEVVATGCRVPNGITQGPDGNIFFTDNQGDWIQSCKLAQVVPGRFYGHPETKKDALPKGTYPDGLSAVWLPYESSRSTSGPVYDHTRGKFGPFADQLFVGDAGYGANPGIMRIALEKVSGEYQGACIRFVDGQPLGCERMKFGPDNYLYLASLTSGLTRMVFDGKTPLAIHSVRIRPRGNGFVVLLTKPLAADTKLKAADFRVTRYHYLYTGNYGSPKAEQVTIPVQAADLSSDRTTITLTFPVETYPIGMVYEINVGKLTAAGGEMLRHNEASYTVQRIP